MFRAEELCGLSIKPKINDIDLNVLQDYYRKFLNPFVYQYDIIEGKKQSSIQLRFDEANFCHLLGIESIVKYSVPKKKICNYKGQGGWDFIQNSGLCFNDLKKITKSKFMEFWFSEFHTPDVKHSIRVSRQLYSKQSDYQRIDIFETPEFGRVLTLDGNVMLTERDEFIYDEMIVHVPMAVHKEAKDILVIGAGDGGVVRELTRYDRVERIDLVEMDPQVVEACRAYLPGNACRMDDRRVHIYFENALKFIRRCEEEYDLIIVDSSDPFGPSEGLFTREFYGSCFNALKEDGIMVNQQGSPFYAEDASAMQRSHKRIASTFPISRVYQAHIPTFAAGYWLFGFASKKYHPIDDLDADAWKALNMRTRYYTARLHVGAFYLPAFLEEMLREVEEH